MEQILTMGVKEFLLSVDIPTLVVYSPKSNAISSVTDLNNPKLVFVSSHELSYDRELSKPYDIKQIVGYGGGTSIDFAKYYASLWGVPCVAIPSMLSTNVFATDKSAVTRNGVKSTESTVLPNKIIYDSKLLVKTPEVTICGLADVLSIHTALRDWRLPGSEPVVNGIYTWAESLLTSAIYLMDRFDERFLEYHTWDAFNLLCSAGFVTNEYGSGRPESGSEHILAKAIEEELDGDIPHAYSVSVGILVSAYLQNSSCLAVKALWRAGVYDKVRKSRITLEVLEKALKRVSPRPDRYSIYDQVVYPMSQKLVDNILEIARLVIWK